MIFITIMTLLVLSAFYPIPAIMRHTHLCILAFEASKEKAVRDRVYDYWYQQNVEKVSHAIGFYTKTFPVMGIWNLALTLSTWALINAHYYSLEIFALTAVSNAAWIVWCCTFDPDPKWLKRWMIQIEVMSLTIKLENTTKRMMECEVLVNAGAENSAELTAEIKHLIQLGGEYAQALEMLSGIEDQLNGIDPVVGNGND